MLEFILANNVLSEVILACGAMILTIFGSSRKESNTRFFLALSIIILIVSGFAIAQLFDLGNTISLFDFFITSQYIAFTKMIIVSLAVFGLLLAMGYDKKKFLFKPAEFSILILLSVLGSCIVLSSNDLFSMYCGMELQAIALYVLASCDRDNLRSSESGMKYFIVGVVASILLLYGISFVFGFTGTTNFSVLVNHVYKGYEQASPIPVGFYIGVTLVVIAICVKIAVAPFHFWAPDVYQGAPLPVTAFLSTVPKVALILFLMRFLYTILYPWLSDFDFIIKSMAILSLLVGSLGALKQTNIKRLLAYASISHIGFILVGFSAESSLGVSSVVLYVIIYALMTFGIFAFISMIQDVKSKENFDLGIFSGLSKDHPVIALSISILLLSMAGFPPLAGFLAKFYIIVAAINAKLYVVVAVALVSSIISTYYYLRIIKIMYFDKKEGDSINYIISTENIIVATFATVFNLILILSPAGLNSLVSMITNNLLK